jgi:hypothetical protein
MDRISSVMATTARRWLDLAATVPDNVLERPAVAGEWSVVDCLRHLLNVERNVFPTQVARFMAGVEELGPLDQAAFPPVEERTARELAEAFARKREENLAMLAALSPEDLERTARSPEHGPVVLGDVVQVWALHDLEHVIQVDRTLQQAFVAGSGRLRPLYRALDMEAGAVESASQ